MRNLRIASLRQPRLHLDDTPKDAATTRIAATAIDPEDDGIYVVTTSPSHVTDERVDLDVWRIGPKQSHLSSFSTPRGLKGVRSPPPLLRKTSTSSASSSNVGKSSQYAEGGHAQHSRAPSEVVSAIVLADGGATVQNEPALCIVCAGGDIALVPTSGLNASQDGHSRSSLGNHGNDDDDPSLPEIAGSVEQGILAATWSPDQELLVLVTAPTPAEMVEDGMSKGATLLIMTREFEVLTESVLQTDDFGEERPIALGWGSKATQFHGSEGPAAAREAEAQDGQILQRSPLNDEDDEGTRISWRGDSTVFAVSTVESETSHCYRIVRMYARNGNLLATSDPSAQGISHTLAFKPTGILWATTQFINGEHRLSFFERNGLYKDHFELQQAGEGVHELAWNSDGTLLALWTAKKVQIWSTGNYHWYLKQQIQPTRPLSGFTWHPENATELYVATHDRVLAYQFAWQTCVSPGRPPHDAACAAVVDGAKILLTPLRIQNVPPPMSSSVLALPPTQVPIDLTWTDVSCAQSGAASILYVLLHGGIVQAWSFSWGILGSSGRNTSQTLWKQPRLLCEFDFGLPARQVAAASTRKGDTVRIAVGVLASEGFESLKLALRKVHLTDGTMGNVRFESLSLGKAIPRLLVSVSQYAGDEPMDAIYVHERKVLRNVTGHVHDIHEALRELKVVSKDSGDLLAIGLTRSGHLYADGRVIAQNMSSFVLTDTHLVWLNNAHEARFLPLADVLIADAASEAVSLARRVERGSRIVAAVPSNMALVLQMPRGNLETIAPRPLLLDVVRRSLDAKRYKKAFNICRTHRLDMNIILDHGEQQLLEDMETFVSQIQRSDYLNLFLSSLTPEHVNRQGRTIGIAEMTTPEKEAKKGRVNSACDAMRAVLLTRPDKDDYIHTILTTHVRKSPPDHESALDMLRELKARDAELADDACKYIIFLTDADKLFDTALGLYDFTLPLLVAHHSPHRDPQEYLPFLRQLREIQPLEMQRFRIDSELGRHGKALSWLLKAGSEYSDQALDFIVKHELYRQALQEVGQNEDMLQQVRELYGDWLMGKQRYKEAGVLFAQCKQPRKALDADVKAGQWQEALALAASAGTGTDVVGKQLAKRICSSLSSYGRFAEAASVTFDYLDDVDAGVRLLCRDALFGEAKRRAVLCGRHDLIDKCVRPMVLDAAKTLLRDITVMQEQSAKQFERLTELRIRKREQPDEYYPDVPGGGDLDDSASLAFSTFTRYTRFSAFTRRAGPSRAPGSTMSQFTMATKKQESQATKSSKREMRKQHTGKKGSIYEEDYIYESLQKLLGTRLGEVQKSMSDLLVHLVRLGDGDAQSQGLIAEHDDAEGMPFAPMSGEDEDRGEDKKRSASELVLALSAALEALEKEVRSDAEQAWEGVVQDDAALEEERVRAIQEGLGLGLSWQQLQDNGLFAPPLQRNLVAVSLTEWRLPALLPE